MNALARYQLGVSFAFMTPRYTFVSALTMASAYLLVISVVANKRMGLSIAVVGVVVSVLGSGMSYARNIEFYEGRQQVLTDSMLRWQLFQKGLAHPSSEHAAAIYRESLKRGIVMAPQMDIDMIAAIPRKAAEVDMAVANMVLSIEHYFANQEYILIDGWAFVEGENNSLSKVWVVFRSSTRTFIVDAISRIRPDVVGHFRRSDLTKSGFLMLLKLSELPEDSYNVGFVIRNGDKTYKKMTGRNIVVGRAEKVASRERLGASETNSEASVVPVLGEYIFKQVETSPPLTHAVAG
jgi:hypothetical protein